MIRNAGRSSHSGKPPSRDSFKGKKHEVRWCTRIDRSPRAPRRISPMLKRVQQFHKANPQVLDFLVLELRAARDSGRTRTSLHNLWHYARWSLTKKNLAPGEIFELPNNLCPYFARIIVILHPECNGFFAMAPSQADADLGTAFDPRVEPGCIRRLMWADGTALENGWRPSTPHEPKPVRRRAPVKRAA